MITSKSIVLKIFFSLLVLLFAIRPVQAQQKIQAGVELDALPYLTGGYFGAVWAGKGHMRARLLYAKVHMPKFMVPAGFSGNTVRSVALMADYFLKKKLTGFWLGSGVVYWDGTLRANEQTASYHTYLLNGSMGYAVNLSKRFYLSPWAGLSFRLGGDQNIRTGGETYRAPFLNPELSLKFGYRF
ncbi:MAG: hypothetical protein JXR71_10540 [Bacteroidales bacterium]|nr:hypothetical protein [Bacteroidales bacterium]